jgi:hypothetical protein
MAPARNNPNNATANRHEFGSCNSTCWPGVIPIPQNPAAARSASPSRSLYVWLPALSITATRSGHVAAASRNTESSGRPVQ